jgi:protein-tyrosine phosphatase
VLHVCTGNICRSPMAELIMRAELDRVYGDVGQNVLLDGGGTYPGHAGMPINPPAGRVLAEINVDSRGFRARALTAAAVSAADLILCATQSHVQAVLDLQPEAAGRTFRLLHLADIASAADAEGTLRRDDPVSRLKGMRDLVASQPPPDHRRFDFDIDDPYGQPDEDYRAARTQIRSAVRAMVG